MSTKTKICRHRIIIDKNIDSNKHWFKDESFIWVVEVSYDEEKSWRLLYKGTKSTRRSALKKALSLLPFSQN